MIFYRPLALEVYVYTEEQIELKKIDDNAVSALQYDDPTEIRYFMSIDNYWQAKEHPGISNLSSGGDVFSIKCDIELLTEKIINQNFMN